MKTNKYFQNITFFDNFESILHIKFNISLSRIHLKTKLVGSGA